MQELVNLLLLNNKTISSMESCTGGGFANELTNIEGVSAIIKFSTVTYSNEFKIKIGVSEEVIEKYSVYSTETAKEMSKAIANYTNSSYGIGITGKLNRIDKNNLFGSDNIVFVSIYDAENNTYFTKEIEVKENTRKKNKAIVINEIVLLLKDII